MYAIELFVGSRLDQYVRDSWKGLKDLHITSALPDIEGIRPHITVAVNDDIDDAEAFGEKLEDLMRSQTILPIAIDSLSAFPETGTVFVAPAVTNELFALHRRYNEHFSAYSSSAHYHYTPDRWNPHCSLAIRLTKIQLTRALACCLNHFKPLQSTIDAIGLVKLQYENGKCVSSITVKEIPFLT